MPFDNPNRTGLERPDHYGLPNDDLGRNDTNDFTSQDFMRHEQQRMPQLQQSTGMSPQMALEQAKSTHIEKDLEVISSKLDALRSQIEILNQRLIRLEHMTESRQEKDSVKW